MTDQLTEDDLPSVPTISETIAALRAELAAALKANTEALPALASEAAASSMSDIRRRLTLLERDVATHQSMLR